MRRSLSRPAVPFALVTAFTAACAAALRHPTPQDVASVTAEWPGTTVQDLERGRRLYVRRCSGCHTLLLPETHTAADWPAYVEVMAGRARLGPSETREVTRFLVALSRGEAPR